MRKSFKFDIPNEDFPRKIDTEGEPSVQTSTVGTTLDDEDLKMTLAIRTSEASVPGAFINSNNDSNRHYGSRGHQSSKPSITQFSNIIHMKQIQRSRGERETPCCLHVDEAQAIDDLCDRMNNFQIETNMKVVKDDGDLAKRYRRKLMGCGIIILIVILLGVLGIVLAVVSRRHRNRHRDASTTSKPSTQVKVEECYSRPTNEQSPRFRALRSVLLSQAPDEVINIDTSWSTARAALCWLADADYFMIDDIEGNEYYIVQRFALASMYYDFVGINAPITIVQPLTLSDWLSETNTCEWKGLSCNGDDLEVVTRIDLGGMNLIASSIPKELMLLTNIEFLSLRKNKIGGMIPTEISRLRKLRMVSFFGNLLTGTIPSELLAIPELIELDVSSNLLSGQMPATVGEATHLQKLNLGINSLEGTIPDMSNLTSLLELGMVQAGGGITGLFPNIHGSSKLEVLVMEDVVLSGTIPSYLWKFSNLSYLALRADQLSGSIPTIIRDLHNLTYLSLRLNSLSGSIPTEIGTLSALTSLDLSYCQSLTGSIPSEIGLLSQLEYMSVPIHLSGSLPLSVCSFPNLASFFGSCQLCSCCKNCGWNV